MSNYQRPRVPGACIFFTLRLADPGSDLLTRHITALRHAVRATMADHPFHIDAMVVLPDHIHALWTLPAGDSAYALRWGAIKARFSRDMGRAGFTPPPSLPTVIKGRHSGITPRPRRTKGEVGLWQRRFWEHHIRDAADFADHLHRCHSDPVRHALVNAPEDWPFSSIHRLRDAPHPVRAAG